MCISGQHGSRSRRLRTVTERTTKSLIPEDGFPPLVLPNPSGPGICDFHLPHFFLIVSETLILGDFVVGVCDFYYLIIFDLI